MLVNLRRLSRRVGEHQKVAEVHTSNISKGTSNSSLFEWEMFTSPRVKFLNCHFICL